MCEKDKRDKELCERFVHEFSESKNYRRRLVYLEGCKNLEVSPIRKDVKDILSCEVEKLKHDPVKFVKNQASLLLRQDTSTESESIKD